MHPLNCLGVWVVRVPRLVQGECWTGGQGHQTKHGPNRQNIVLKFVFSTPPDNFWTFSDILSTFSDILSTFPFSGLAALPAC